MVHRTLFTLTGVALAATLAMGGRAEAEPSTAVVEPSPAGCRVEQLANPHFARSVPGAVKVNAKAQCNAPVPEQTMTVTMLVDGKPFHRTESKATSKAFLYNQATFVVCKNFIRKHTFQGAALGVSWEAGRPFLQAKQGPIVEIPCDV